MRERGSGEEPHYTMCGSDGVTYADTALTGVDCSFTTTDLKAYIRNANTDAMTFNYDSYRNIYNNGSQNLRYVASDAFTEAEFTSYLEFVESTIKDENNDDITRYGTQFKSGKKAEFIAKKAPFVDNFMKSMSRDFANPTSEGFQQDNRQYTATILSTTRGSNEVTIEFHCPYAYSAGDTGITFTEDPSTHHIMKLANNATQNTTGITAPYLGWYCLNKNHSGYFSNPIFFSAPASIYDGDTQLKFQYWSVKNIPSVNDKNTVAQEYARCYSLEFIKLFRITANLPSEYGTTPMHINTPRTTTSHTSCLTA